MPRPTLNKVFLLGNLTSDPEFRKLPGGSTLMKFTLAVNRRYRQGMEWREETSFIPIVVWGDLAENARKFLQKGSMVLVEGRISVRKWETAEGQRRSTFEVVAERLQYIARLKERELSPDVEEEIFEDLASEVESDDSEAEEGLSDLSEDSDFEDDFPF